MPRPIVAEIHLSAIAHNLALTQANAAGAFVWAVIKANAYGHGIERIYPALTQADGIALLDFSEAIRVRKLGWTKPILMLEGCFESSDLALCEAYDLWHVVHQTQQLTWLEASRQSHTLYIKINSGMNRLGLPPKTWEHWAKRLACMTHHRIQAWMTHFANADQIHGSQSANAVFESTLTTVFAQYPALRASKSVNNSAAIFNSKAHNHFPSNTANSVRAGIVLYGSSPMSEKSAHRLSLRPAMHLYSKLIAIQELQAGDTVGYGSTFTATKPMKIGVVACGYADGYPRQAGTGTPISVNMQRTRIVGRVSMDMLTVDLDGIQHAQIGSVVELWGASIDIDEVAQAAGTIGYELMCALAARVPTVVHN